MGKRSQEHMTGKTYEERVRAAQASKGLLRRLVKRIRWINKPSPTRYANVSRSGHANINPELMKRRRNVSGRGVQQTPRIP